MNKNMARIVNREFIPTDIVSNTLVGIASNGQTKNLIKIEK